MSHKHEPTVVAKGQRRIDEVQPVEPGGARQIMALVGSPAAVLASMQIKYVLVPWACQSGTIVALHLTAAAGLLGAIACGWLARREWSAAGGGWPDDEGGAGGRSRFLGLLGMLMSGVSAIVILAQWIPELFLSPCHQ